jgi:hypothetical protein
MAKLKPAKKTKTKPRRALGVIPCAFLIISGIALLSLLFYAVLRSVE